MNPILLEGAQNTPEWFAVKAGKITGTRFASAMAETDSAAYNNLVSGLATERLFGAQKGDSYRSRAMEMGKKLEPDAFGWYSFQTDAPCQQPMFAIHGAIPYVGVSPDLLVGDDGMAQMKCPEPTAWFYLLRKQRVPPAYFWQVQGELWVCNRAWSDFVCYHPELGVVMERVYRHEASIRALETACINVHLEAQDLVQTYRSKQ